MDHRTYARVCIVAEAVDIVRWADEVYEDLMEQARKASTEAEAKAIRLHAGAIRRWSGLALLYAVLATADESVREH